MGAVTLYHWLFSFAFPFVYIFLSAYAPKIRVYYGVVYGVLITVFDHEIMIPLLGFRHPLYNGGEVGWLWVLNGYELWSEILGHIYWAVSIEIFLITVLASLGRPIYGIWTNPIERK